MTRWKAFWDISTISSLQCETKTKTKKTKPIDSFRFTIECGMKLLALHYKYFTIPWNVFDFIIVLASILGQVLGEIFAKYLVNPTILRVVRVARVGRVLRLVKGQKNTTILFKKKFSTKSIDFRSKRNSNITFCFGRFNACIIQHWSSSFLSYVHLFDLWNVVFRLCEKIGRCHGIVQFRNISKFINYSLSNVYNSWMGWSFTSIDQ